MNIASRLSTDKGFKLLSYVHELILWNRYFVAVVLLVASRFIGLFSRKYSLKILLKSLRLRVTPFGVTQLKYLFPYLEDNLDYFISSDDDITVASNRSIVVCWPQFNDGIVTQKGVIVITYTTSFSAFYRCIKVDLLAKYFHIVLEPSSAGYADPDILYWPSASKCKVFVQASEIEDRVLLSSLDVGLVPLSIGASNWVDTNIFHDKLLYKKYDCIYVANTNPVKRVGRYLKAVRAIQKSTPDYRALLVCAKWGFGFDYIESMISSYGLDGKIDVVYSASQSKLVDLLNQSKVNLLLSLKEGSNRSLFEAMACNTPVICICENVGVNKSYINEYTGLLVFDSTLETAMLSMRDGYQRFAPRKWLLQNVSSESSIELIKDIAGVHGECLMKVNAPEVKYAGLRGDYHYKYMQRIIGLFEKESPAKSLPEKIEQIEKEFMSNLLEGKE